MIEENNFNSTSKENNKNDISDISQEDNKIYLLNRLKEIHRKSEEKTFDLNEKFNQIKDGFQKLIDSYQNNLFNEEESENNLDFFSLHKYINNYIYNSRDISINNINKVFEEINEVINSKKEKNLEEKEDIKTSLIEVKNEYDAIYEETVNHFEEKKIQKDEIKNKIDIQMEEQFEKVFQKINNGIENGGKGKNEIINVTQNYLEDLRKKMKKEKIEK